MHRSSIPTTHRTSLIARSLPSATSSTASGSCSRISARRRSRALASWISSTPSTALGSSLADGAALRDHMDALGLDRDGHGSIEVRGGAGILLIDDPLTFVHGHPVAHEVAEERAARDNAGETDAVRVGGARHERERLGAHAEAHLASRVERKACGLSHGDGALAERDHDLLAAHLAHGPGHEVDRTHEVREERG